MNSFLISKHENGVVLIDRIPCLFLIIVAILTATLLPALSRSRECARRANCTSNLKQLGIAIHMYAQDYREYFPENLSQLYPAYISDSNRFICPSKRGVTKGSILKNFDICYQYVSGMTEEYEADCLLAFDRKGNHTGQDNHNRAGRNLLFLDGHLEWILEENWESTWQKHIEKSEESNLVRCNKSKTNNTIINPNAGGFSVPTIEIDYKVSEIFEFKDFISIMENGKDHGKNPIKL